MAERLSPKRQARLEQIRRNIHRQRIVDAIAECEWWAGLYRAQLNDLLEGEGVHPTAAPVAPPWPAVSSKAFARGFRRWCALRACGRRAEVPR